jgi:hypothetical protein
MNYTAILDVIVDMTVGLGICAAIVGVFWPVADPLDIELDAPHDTTQ